MYVYIHLLCIFVDVKMICMIYSILNLLEQYATVLAHFSTCSTYDTYCRIHFTQYQSNAISNVYFHVHIYIHIYVYIHSISILSIRSILSI